jgi:hypothetical protein
MAVLAFIRNVREIEIGMAVAACHGSMPPAERKASLGVIEPDLAWDHLPIGNGMTCITGDFESAMGALR